MKAEFGLVVNVPPELAADDEVFRQFYVQMWCEEVAHHGGSIIPDEPDPEATLWRTSHGGTLVYGIMGYADNGE